MKQEALTPDYIRTVLEIMTPEQAAQEIITQEQAWIRHEAETKASEYYTRDRMAHERTGLAWNIVGYGACFGILSLCAWGGVQSSQRASDFQYWAGRVCAQGNTTGCIQAVSAEQRDGEENANTRRLRALYKAATKVELPLEAQK